MTVKLNLYIDRLKEEKVEPINEALPASVLELEEAELQFSGKINIEGRTYLTEDFLVIDLNVNVDAHLPCAICNETLKIPIIVKKEQLTVEQESIKGAIYNYFPKVREAILLEVPSFVECEGNCPNRSEIKNYLSEDTREKKSTKDVNFPFANLNES